jgi:hypothetical protein
MPKRQRDLLLEALQKPATAAGIPPSPALGFVSGFVPTLITMQEQQRRAESEAQLEAQKQLAHLLAEREKRQVVLSTPLAQILQTAAQRYLGVMPEVTAGMVMRPEELATMSRLIGLGLQQQLLEQRLQQEAAIEDLKAKERQRLQEAKNVEDYRKKLREEADLLNDVLQRYDRMQQYVGLTPEQQIIYNKTQQHLEGIRQILREIEGLPEERFQEIKREPDTFLDRIGNIIRGIFPSAAVLFPPRQPQSLTREQLEQMYREFFPEER